MRRILITLAALAPIMLTASASAAVYTVNPGGSDAGNGQSWPWKTLSHAAATVGPGDAVLIEAGTYNEPLEIYNGGGWLGAKGAKVPLVVVNSSHTVVMGLTSCFIVEGRKEALWDVTLMGDMSAECVYSREGPYQLLNGWSLP